jgi:hypothetical protein
MNSVVFSKDLADKYWKYLAFGLSNWFLILSGANENNTRVENTNAARARFYAGLMQDAYNVSGMFAHTSAREGRKETGASQSEICQRGRSATFYV